MLGYELPASYKLLEQNTVANIYYHARKAGIKLLLEVRIPVSQFKRGNCRVDLALVHKRLVLAVIEVKRSNNSDISFQNNKKNRNGKQYQKYKQLEENYGVRIFFANNKTDISLLVKQLLKIQKLHIKKLKA